MSGSPLQVSRSILLAATLVLFAHCSKSDVVVKVGNLPKEAVTLEAMARVGGVQPDETVQFTLPAQSQEEAPRLSFTIGLRLVSPGPGEAVVAVAARDAQGCLLTSGSARVADLDQLSSQPGEELLVLLREQPPVDPDQPARCLRELPSLISASEQVQSADAQRALLLSGWGFKPAATVTVNGAPAEGLRAHSPAEIFIDLPRVSDPSGVQTFEIVVTNPDGSRASIRTQISQPLFNTVGTLLYRPDSSAGPSFFAGLAVEDVNGDGRPDLVVAGTQVVDVPGDDINVGFVRILAQQADGSYPATPLNLALGTGALPLGLTVGDFNGDGRRDVAVLALIEVLKSIGFVTVMYGQADGTLTDPSLGYTNLSYPVEQQGLAVSSADLDADGRSELILLSKNFLLPTPQLGIFEFQDPKTYREKWTAQLLIGLEQITQIAAADLNQDGLLDLAFGSVRAGDGQAQAQLLIRTTSGSMQFSQQGQIALPGLYGRMAIANLRGGAYPDLVIANRLSPSVSPPQPLRTVSVIGVGKDGGGSSTLGPLGEYRVGSTPVDLAIDDYDGNGKLDIAAATVEGVTTSDGTLEPHISIKILLNQTTGGLPSSLDVLPTLDAGPARCAFVLSRDVNRDARPDLVAATCGDTNRRTSAELHLFTAQR